MARVVLENVSKHFGEVTAVEDFDLVIEDNEFVVIVGPSGCGKTTALRLIAGLEAVSEGAIYIDDRKVNDVPPKDRDIAMVFQNYALYPHMTVYGNMAFGLKLRRVKRAEADTRVREAARILQIDHLLERRPRELSGGQRQRVALGRAIVRQPKVFLMDEPLSNLDAKLRVGMRASLAELHEQLGVTTVYVTHDQVEAMTMGTRIVVMKDGRIQQVDTPINLYNNPRSKFVADFIGSPAMNFLKGRVENGHIKSGFFDVKPDEFLVGKLGPYEGRELYLGIRPENLGLKGVSDVPEKDNAIRARVKLVEPIGAETIIIGTVGDDPITARVEPEAEVKAGDSIVLLAKPHKVHAFDAEDEHNLRFTERIAAAIKEKTNDGHGRPGGVRQHPARDGRLARGDLGTAGA